MHILDDPTNSARVARFLAARGERWAPTSVDQIRQLQTVGKPSVPLLEGHDSLNQVIWHGRKPTIWAVAERSDLQLVEEATGPADRWWYDDGESAIHLTLDRWPEGEDHWLLRCFARTMKQLPDVLHR
jgi:hypothetical protein